MAQPFPYTLRSLRNDSGHTAAVAIIALAAFAVQSHLYPGKKQFLQYTTTSPAMQKRLGVAGG